MEQLCSLFPWVTNALKDTHLYLPQKLTNKYCNMQVLCSPCASLLAAAVKQSPFPSYHSFGPRLNSFKMITLQRGAPVQGKAEHVFYEKQF